MVRDQQEGFSTLEMIVVMLITLILGQLAVVKIGELREAFLFERQQSAIVSKLEEIAIRATQEGYSYTLNFATNKLTVTSGIGDSKAIEMAPGFSFLQTPKQVTFYAGGTSSPESIGLQGLGRTCLINISLRGRISQCL